MKKKFLNIIALLLSASLVTGCNEGKTSTNPSNDGSSANNYGDVSNDNNDSIAPDSSIDDNNPLEPTSDFDKMVAEFVSDLDVNIPLTTDFNLEECEVFYYYAYEQYVVYGAADDIDGLLADQYASLFTDDTNLVSFNDEDYPVEDYGYYFADNEQNIIINFYSEDGYFVISIYRYDGLAGSLDVSDVDTNWYVDYINFDGYSLFDFFPGDLIGDYLGIEATVIVPTLTNDSFPGAFIPGYDDDFYGSVPDTFVIILEGDQLSSSIDILDKAGYITRIDEKEDITIDWDTFELVTYTYEVGVAYDTDKNIYISIELDENENTAGSFNIFSALYTADKTSNTDWTDEEKALMNETLHQLLPFMQFGEDYEISDGSDEDWTLLILEDTYSEDLTTDYINLLLSNGFFIDDVTWSETYYCYDNGYVYIEIYIEYDGGNYLEIYYEDSHLEPLTSFSLDVASLDIIAGVSYQLTPIYNPTSAVHPTTWSSSNENIATVSENGLVTINSSADVNTSVVISATTLSGKVATCTFNIKANEVTGIAFKQDNYNVLLGAEPIFAEYYYLPYGATTNEDKTYSINPDNIGINYSNGMISASESAVIGSTATITVICGTVSDSATVTVVPASITHTLTGGFFGIPEKESSYSTYKKSVDGASYEAQASAGNDADNGKGLQLRSKNSNSGVIGHFEGRTCKSITFSFDARTEVTGKSRYIEIYASNSPFAITDMYGSNVAKVGTITFDKNNLVQTYTFTADYTYIGFRSGDGAVYLKSVEVVW